jgi:hypothetical protein
MAETSLATTQPKQIERAETFAPRNLQEAFQFADMVLTSGMAPKSYLELITKTKDGSAVARAAVVVALQFGLEVGFQPMQALQCIANINGNPSVWGDGALALVQSSGLLEWIREDDFETIKANKKATCVVKRRGDPEEKKITFSYQDAIDGGIFGHTTWKSYPYRMCMFRARGFALRDKFPDVLKGLKIAEEVMDYIEGDVVEPQPKPSGSIQVPTALAEAGKDAPAETAAPEAKPETKAVVTKPDVISIEEAKQWYKAYTATGHKPDEAKAWLKETFDITDSRMIPSVQFENAMAWANTPKVEENLDAEPA